MVLELSEWRSDWGSFVRYACNLYASGQNDAAISANVGGHRVTWRGAIKAMKLDAPAPLGVTFSMDPYRLKLPNGKSLIAGHLFVSVDKADDWAECKVGQVVLFEATIVASNGPFNGVQIHEYEDDDDVLLMLTVRHGRPLQVGLDWG